MTSTASYANQTKRYSCMIERYYRHPVSGEIEDSGGEKSFEIGQGMVEGTVYDNGLVEMDASGQLYLTIKMSLADFSGNYQFWVQEGGVGPFQAVNYQITGRGSDTNGSTNDILIPLSNSQSIVKVSMFVEPMGRQVFFYLKPSAFQEIARRDEEGALDDSKRTEDSEPSPLAQSENKKEKSDKESVIKPNELEKVKHGTATKHAHNNSGKNQSLSKSAANKKGLQTSLDDKVKKKQKKKASLLVLIYYLPTLLVLGIVLGLMIKKKRK